MRSPCVELTRQTYVFPASLYNLGAAGLWCGYATKDSKLEHIVDTPERKINSLCRGQARDGRASLFTVSAPENRCSTHVQLNLRVIRRAELAIWNRARRKGTHSPHFTNAIPYKYQNYLETTISTPYLRSCTTSVEARLAQSVEREALNLVVVGSSPTVGMRGHQPPMQLHSAPLV